MLVYICTICGKIGGDEEKPFSTPICCGQEKGTTNIVSNLPSIYVMPSYQSPITGRWIDTSRQRRNDLAASGCVEYEPSMKAEQTKRHTKEDEQLDKKVDEIVEREIYNMPTEKREKLAVELETSDIDVVRK